MPSAVSALGLLGEKPHGVFYFLGGFGKAALASEDQAEIDEGLSERALRIVLHGLPE